jgi:hypothetical protein
MPSQTFTVTNVGSMTVVLDQFVFETPPGLRHVANLVNFGGPSNVTANTFIVTVPILTPTQSKTFIVDYEFLSGVPGLRHGNIYVSSTTGRVVTICADINVVTGPQPETEMVTRCTMVPSSVSLTIFRNEEIASPAPPGSEGSGGSTGGSNGLSVTPATGTWPVNPGLNVTPTTGTWPVSP